MERRDTTFRRGTRQTVARVVNTFVQEEGQELVEFALVATLMITLLMVPIDMFRYINTKMLLNDAVTGAVSSLTKESINSNHVSADIVSSVAQSYGGRLDASKLNVEDVHVSAPTKESYTYYVYNSDKEGAPDFSGKFDERASNYQYCAVSARLVYHETALTPIGGLFLGGSNWTITSDTKTNNVYLGGYTQ